MLEDLGPPRPLAFGLHIKNIFRERKKFKENVKAYALLFVFQSQRENATVAASKNILPFSPIDAFLLNIKKIFTKSNLIHLLKNNTGMDFQLISLLSKKGGRGMFVNAEAIRYTKMQAMFHGDTQETHV